MAQKYEREPGLGAGLNLLNLFGLDSTTARVWGAFIIVLVIAYFIIRFRYPCRSPSSLTEVVDRASKLFDECHAMGAFRRGDYDRYHIILQRLTSCASEIASRTHPNESNAPGQRSSLHRDYFEKTSFLWKRLKDIVDCHLPAPTEGSCPRISC
ncbi:hypothetical protein E1B28_006898 [Marasmius oreades]|uniref:Uncharacterized protein n=1 Tax=Marasmius oreades TaxID=181124 RepID=A0A9P7USW3_9AGAR|nr:uncharacterized protein E1B28_006898 [Marasmius oreades]KAG7093212.1 hypothetical protein E1B28_006898 [Marasmius oreades]